MNSIGTLDSSSRDAFEKQRSSTLTYCSVEKFLLGRRVTVVNEEAPATWSRSWTTAALTTAIGGIELALSVGYNVVRSGGWQQSGPGVPLVNTTYCPPNISSAASEAFSQEQLQRFAAGPQAYDYAGVYGRPWGKGLAGLPLAILGFLAVPAAYYIKRKFTQYGCCSGNGLDREATRVNEIIARYFSANSQEFNDRPFAPATQLSTIFPLLGKEEKKKLNFEQIWEMYRDDPSIVEQAMEGESFSLSQQKYWRKAATFLKPGLSSEEFAAALDNSYNRILFEEEPAILDFLIQHVNPSILRFQVLKKIYEIHPQFRDKRRFSYSDFERIVEIMIQEKASLKHAINRVLLEGQADKLVLSVGGSQFATSRRLLSEHSEVFQKMLNEKWKEATSESVSLYGVDPHAVFCVLEYVKKRKQDWAAKEQGTILEFCNQYQIDICQSLKLPDLGTDETKQFQFYLELADFYDLVELTASLDWLLCRHLVLLEEANELSPSLAYWHELALEYCLKDSIHQFEMFFSTFFAKNPQLLGRYCKQLAKESNSQRATSRLCAYIHDPKNFLTVLMNWGEIPRDLICKREIYDI